MFRRILFAISIQFIVSVNFTNLTFAGAPDYSIHQEYISTRALGMGNAFIAVADDHSAIFYNPAGLAFRKDTQLRMLVRVGSDADVPKFYDDISTDDKVNDQTTRETDINNTLIKYYGDDMYFRVTTGALLARPKWGFAFIPADFSADLSLHQSVGPSIFMNAYADSTLAFSRAGFFNMPWFNKKKYPVAIGATAKIINRGFYSDILQSTELAQTQTHLVNLDQAQEGATFDIDVGFLYMPDVGESAWIKPSYALVVRNTLDYGFPVDFHLYNKQAQISPPRLQRRLDVGTKLGLPGFWVFDPKFALDIKDIGYTTWTPMKGFHAGFELYWKMYNWWKGHWSAGINQGYWTAGFGARMAIFQLDLASWGEEVGTTDARSESRRYILEASLDF